MSARGGFALVPLLPLLAVVPACEPGLGDKAPLPTLDEAYFRCRVQPVLTKNCAMLACHGTPDRYYRIYARNRLRYGIAGEAERNSVLNAGEARHNFDATRAYVDVGNEGESLVLKKTLATDAGGFYHGATQLGNANIFPDVEWPEYKVILDWAKGAKEDPACIEPGSDQ